MGLPLLPIIFQNPGPAESLGNFLAPTAVLTSSLPPERTNRTSHGYVISTADRTISIGAPKVSPSAAPAPTPIDDKFNKVDSAKRVSAVKKRANRYACRADVHSTGIRFPYFLNFGDGTLRACEAFPGTTFPRSRILRVDATPGGVVHLEAIPDQLDDITRHNNTRPVRILIPHRYLVEYIRTQNPKVAATAAETLERIAPGNVVEYLLVDAKGISARISGEARTPVAPLHAEPVVTIDVIPEDECPAAELNVGDTKIRTIRESPSPRSGSAETIEIRTRIEITTADAATPESTISPHNQRFTITPPAGMTPQDFADAVLSWARTEATGAYRLSVSVLKPQGMSSGTDDASFNASICAERNTPIRDILFSATNGSNDTRSIETQLQKITAGSGIRF